MEERRHSGFGIASFITSIVSAILIFLLVVILGVMEASTPGGLDENSAGAMTGGIFMFAFLGASLLALVLGIVGSVQNDRKKVFAILGTVISAVSLVTTIFLIVLGLAMD